ncbi:MAG TPA: 16S rRNA (uracil(1498)-N(3))-methyltransferase [Caldimonas sp.]|jgi:16S rRNA (uracil1498-N3)-methyltransferase
MPRIFLPVSLATDATVVLSAPAIRHVQALRLKPGDALELFNGRDDADWPGEIVEVGRHRVIVRVGAPVAVARELDDEVTLALGVPANDRMDALVEKAGELGAAAIQPLVCARSVLRLAGERAEARRRHWQAVAAAASEQCGRARVATLLPIAALAQWLRSADVAAASVRIVLSFDRSALAPERALAARDASSAGVRSRIVVLSGPEGGLAPAEEDAAVDHGFVRVGLGARVLRADTAPLAWLGWLGLRSLGGGGGGGRGDRR